MGLIDYKNKTQLEFLIFQFGFVYIYNKKLKRFYNYVIKYICYKIKFIQLKL